MKRNFTLGAVLSVAGDKMMCNIEKVFEILNFMTGDNLFIHQLPRAAGECRPSLMTQHPWLTEYVQSVQHQVTSKNYRAILADCKSRWGEKVNVEELSAVDKHIFKDPLQELCEMVGPDRVVTVDGLDGQ